MALTNNSGNKIFPYLALILTLITILHHSREQIQQFQARFERAYSYIIVKKQRTTICFNDVRNISIKLKAISPTHCINKCQITINFNLRGINYMTSSGSCSCFPKMDVWYNVTTDLTGGCTAFVTHTCPTSFDYVIENHKCYKFITVQNTWMNSSIYCNSYFSSHMVIIERALENDVVIQYTLAVLNGINGTTCPFVGNKNYLGFWTGGLRTYNNSVPTVFFWWPYATVYVPMDFRFWGKSQPNAVYNGLDSCVSFGLQSPYIGWDDNFCWLKHCFVCEYDIQM